MPEDPKPSITADEFERSYAEAGGMTVDELRLFKTVRPCDCGDESCRGWQSMYHEQAAIFDAATRMGMTVLQYEAWFFSRHRRLPSSTDLVHE